MRNGQIFLVIEDPFDILDTSVQRVSVCVWEKGGHNGQYLGWARVLAHEEISLPKDTPAEQRADLLPGKIIEAKKALCDRIMAAKVGMK